jgi:4-hydroxy-4-methyl-2-oxoglutarate aldolase
VWNPAGNNSMIRFGIESATAGSFIVVATPQAGAAQWGEIAHEWATARGANGVLVDGSVRDVEAVREVGLSLWASSVDPRQANKSILGTVNAPISVHGAVVVPGDLVVADDDGFVVVARLDVESTLAAAQSRAEREAATRAHARTGETPPDLVRIFGREGIVHRGPWGAPT